MEPLTFADWLVDSDYVSYIPDEAYDEYLRYGKSRRASRGMHSSRHYRQAAPAKPPRILTFPDWLVEKNYVDPFDLATGVKMSIPEEAYDEYEGYLLLSGVPESRVHLYLPEQPSEERVIEPAYEYRPSPYGKSRITYGKRASRIARHKRYDY